MRKLNFAEFGQSQGYGNFPIRCIICTVVDGKGAVTFLVRVKEALEDSRRLLMDL